MIYYTMKSISKDQWKSTAKNIKLNVYFTTPKLNECDLITVWYDGLFSISILSAVEWLHYICTIAEMYIF